MSDHTTDVDNGKNTATSVDKLNKPSVLESELSSLEERHRDPIVRGCFIATAAMDSELHPYVQSLRDFRDQILLKSRYKGTFESLLEKYYRFSPPVARLMKKNQWLKLVLRYILVYPIVFTIKMVLPIFNWILGIERDAKSRINLIYHLNEK
jgi:hypothetical protein